MTGADVPIDLWLWPLDTGTARAGSLAGLLSPDEGARARRFVRPGDARRYTAARGGLRRVLATYARVAPRDLRFAYGPGGKPALSVGPAFNLSHSGGWAALAVGPPGLDLGLDIEGPAAWDPSLAQSFLSPQENADLDALPPEDRAAAFLRCWTLKEALIKAQGDGLAIPLDSFTVAGSAAGRPVLERAEPPLAPARDWVLRDLRLPGGYAGAIALRGAAATVRWRDRRDAGL